MILGCWQDVRTPYFFEAIKTIQFSICCNLRYGLLKTPLRYLACFYCPTWSKNFIPILLFSSICLCYAKCEDLISDMARNKGFIPSAPGEISIQRKQLKAIIESLLAACTEPDMETGVPFKAQAIIANPPAYGEQTEFEISTSESLS